MSNETSMLLKTFKNCMAIYYYMAYDNMYSKVETIK